MQITLKFLSTKSGKSVILKIENKAYVFNLFEGFQRYCIQEQFSLASIDTIFLTSRHNFPALIGTYLTMCESEKSALNIVSDFDVDFYSIHKHAISPDLKLDFFSKFSDKFISVESFVTNKISNFIVKLPKIKGKLHPEKIPSHIPKILYKKLLSDGILEFNGDLYNLNDFADQSINLNSICLFFDEINSETVNIDNYTSKIECFICFTRSSYVYFSKRIPNISKNNFKGVFYVHDNHFVEYIDFYCDQLEANKVDPRFLIPYFDNKIDAGDQEPILDDSLPKIIETGDQMIFDKKNGLKVLRGKNTKPVLAEYNPVFPCVEFLGTGCAIPSKEKNVSAILYQNDKSAILMDCGEDTMSQIIRLHGSMDVFKKIKVIFISHSHADHMLGIAKIVENIENSLLIIAPYYIKEYLEYFGNNIDVINENTDILENYSLKSDDMENNKPKEIRMLTTNFIKAIEQRFYEEMPSDQSEWDKYIYKFKFNEFIFTICGCIHSKTSVSVNIEDERASKSFSYSGDTIPNPLFSYISRSNDLMIHEATFDRENASQAHKTYHSIRDEAIECFDKSKSKNLLLTHFSNRVQQNESDGLNVRDFFRFVFD